ncbi:MAG TPA: hypothetical protein VFL94_03940 [Actinomycetales bacterium]|nr:hypothetical protein [Actinomycetales bacterium]
MRARPGLAAAVVATVALVGVPAAAAQTTAQTTAPGATQVVTVSDPRISESSGLVASPTHPGLVWTVNDSGHTASVFGVSLETGRTVAVLRLRGTDARDWESMAAQRGADGRGLLWVGDTGDNSVKRESIVLRLVREPATMPKAGAVVDVTPVSLRVRYPDGPHDVEALVATPDGRLLLVTKELFAGTVYEVPAQAVATVVGGTSVSQPVTARNVGGVRQSLVTDASLLPDGRIVLRGYVDAVICRDRTKDDRGLEVERRIPLPPQEQGETLTVVDGGAAILVGSEGVKQPLWRVPLSAPPAAGAATASATSGAAPSAASHPRTTAADRAPATPSHDVLVWALRIAALVLIPIAFLLARRRR